MDKIIKNHPIFKEDLMGGEFYKKLHKYSKILGFEERDGIITLENPLMLLELRKFLLIRRGEKMGKEGYTYKYIGKIKDVGYLFEIIKD